MSSFIETVDAFGWKQIVRNPNREVVKLELENLSGKLLACICDRSPDGITYILNGKLAEPAEVATVIRAFHDAAGGSIRWSISYL